VTAPESARSTPSATGELTGTVSAIASKAPLPAERLSAPVLHEPLASCATTVQVMFASEPSARVRLIATVNALAVELATNTVPVTTPLLSSTQTWEVTWLWKPVSVEPQYCGSSAVAVPGEPVAGVPVAELCVVLCEGVAWAAAIGSTTTPTIVAASATERTWPGRREFVGVRLSFVPCIREALPRRRWVTRVDQGPGMWPDRTGVSEEC